MTAPRGYCWRSRIHATVPMSFSQSGRRRQSSKRHLAAVLRGRHSKSRARRARHVAVADRDVDLVVVLERTVVEIGRADHRPEIVDEQRLHVRHARLVFEDAHARLEQLAVHAPARQPNPALIGLRARHDDRQLRRLASPCGGTRRRNALSGRKYGVEMQDAARSTPSTSVWNSDTRRGRAIGRRALDRERRDVAGGRAACRFAAGEDLAAAFEPVLRDDALDVGDDRPLDPRHHVAPHRACRATRPRPPVGDARAADERDAPSTTSSSRCVRLLRRPGGTT